jgi:hypothetical protein
MRGGPGWGPRPRNRWRRITNPHRKLGRRPLSHTPGQTSRADRRLPRRLPCRRRREHPRPKLPPSNFGYPSQV